MMAAEGASNPPEDGTPSAGVGEPRPARPPRRWAAALVLLCAAALVLLFTRIDRTVPYPQHADEGFISGPASNILLTGSLHPPRFNYPSLPTYYAAAAMAFGFLRGAAHLEMRDVKQIGNVGYPFYDNPRPMKTARQAFALLAIICLGMTGLAAWLAFRRPSTMVLAPLLVLATPQFFRQAWTYLNVDIAGACFVMLTVGACLAGTARPGTVRSAILPGVLAGLAAGCKYTLVIAIVPVLLGIVLYLPRHAAVRAGLAAIGSMIAAFLAAVPYSLLDIPGFLNGVGYEVFHYASGHAGAAGDPGLPQLIYYLRHFLSEFGYGASAAALLGIAAFPWRDWRRALVIAAFPLGLLWLLTTQRVHFTRNAVAIHPFIAMYAAFGLTVVHGWIVALTGRRTRGSAGRYVPALAALALVAITVPYWHVASLFRNITDSRNLARAWVAENLPYDWTLVVPSELGLDPRGFEIRGRKVKVVALKPVGDPQALDALLADVQAPAAMMVPRWGADRRSPGRATADALNALMPRGRRVASFGTNDVLVNYLWPTAWGDPAFSIAILK